MSGNKSATVARFQWWADSGMGNVIQNDIFEEPNGYFLYGRIAPPNSTSLDTNDAVPYLAVENTLTVHK